jgi:phosphoglycerate dehydrogenase-like enzyme
MKGGDNRRGRAMAVTVLYPETLRPEDAVEGAIFGPGARLVHLPCEALAELGDADLAEVEGLMILRHWVREEDMARMPKLRAIVRMGVGYDRLDRAAAARRNVLICNVPDYGTTEVADHALALALALRRGVILHHEKQRHDPPAAWTPIEGELTRRSSVQTFGIVGLGRIGTAVALRAKAFGFRVVAFDPYIPNGTELAIGVERFRSLDEMLRQTDTLSIHTPLTVETRGMIGRAQLALLKRGAVVVNTARGPILDIDALGEKLREGHIAAAGLDVLPVEPPVEPLPALVRAYRARESWLEGRLVITPHSAFHTPEAYYDIRTKSAETMRAALIDGRPQNMITPEMS